MGELKLGFTAQQIIDEGRITEEDISLLKTWLATQDFPELTDEQIVLFLLSCNNEQDSTKETIKAFYSIRNKAPHVFDNRKLDQDDIRLQMNTFDFCIFPERTDDGSAVIFCRLNDTTYYNTFMEPSTKLCLMTVDAALFDHPPKGLVVLIDLKGVGLMHLTRIRISIIKIFFKYIQEAMPVKLKEVHVLNTVYFIDKLLYIFKPFIKKEVMEQVHFHQSNMDMEKFYKKWMPKRCLPEDYGGDLPSVAILKEKTIEKLANVESYFDAEQLQRHS